MAATHVVVPQGCLEHQLLIFSLKTLCLASSVPLMGTHIYHMVKPHQHPVKALWRQPVVQETLLPTPLLLILPWASKGLAEHSHIPWLQTTLLVSAVPLFCSSQTVHLALAACSSINHLLVCSPAALPMPLRRQHGRWKNGSSGILCAGRSSSSWEMNTVCGAELAQPCRARGC